MNEFIQCRCIIGTFGTSSMFGYRILIIKYKLKWTMHRTPFNRSIIIIPFDCFRCELIIWAVGKVVLCW